MGLQFSPQLILFKGTSRYYYTKLPTLLQLAESKKTNDHIFFIVRKVRTKLLTVWLTSTVHHNFFNTSLYSRQAKVFYITTLWLNSVFFLRLNPFKTA